MNTPSDEQLMIDYVAGMTDRFELLVRRHSQELFNFLTRFTGNGAMAEDAVQETFLQVHLSATSFDSNRRFKPWLYTIGVNKARDLLRSRSRRTEVPLGLHSGGDDENDRSFLDLLPASGEDPSDSLERREESERVRTVVGQLSAPLQEVLILGYYHRFPYKEIADILDIPLGTVKSRLHAAVARFGEMYKQATGQSAGPAGDSIERKRT